MGGVLAVAGAVLGVLALTHGPATAPADVFLSLIHI